MKKHSRTIPARMTAYRDGVTWDLLDLSGPIWIVCLDGRPVAIRRTPDGGQAAHLRLALPTKGAAQTRAKQIAEVFEISPPNRVRAVPWVGDPFYHLR